MEASLLDAVVAALAMFLGSVSLSAIGFGIGMIAVPGILLVAEPDVAVVVVGTAGSGIALWIVVQSRKDIPFREALPIALAGACGVPFSVGLLASAPAVPMRIGVTAFIIIFAIVSVIKTPEHIPYSKPLGILGGFLAGLLLPAFGAGGQLVMLFLLTRNWRRQSVRASMALYLATVTMCAIVWYAVNGLYTRESLTLIGVALIPAVIGLVVGAPLIKRMSERVFRYAVMTIIFASSVVVLVRTTLELI